MRKLVALTAFLVPSALHAQARSVDVSGVLFGNYQMRVDESAKATTGGEPAGKFDIARAYFNLRGSAGERGSVRVTADVFQNTGAGYYNGWTMRLKYGYFQYDITDNLGGVRGLEAAARVGMLQTVVVEHIETFWPRWMGNAAVEQSGFFASADVGLSSLVSLPNNRGEAYITITNGNGYTSAETDRFKDFAARFSFTPFANDSGLFRSFTITPWYYKGWSASQFVTGGPGQVGPVSDGLQKDRRGLFFGIRDRRLTGGLDLAQRLEEREAGLNTAASPRSTSDRTSTLVSGFAIVRPLEVLNPGKRSRLALIGRYDDLDLDTDAPAATGAPESRFLVAGLMWDLNSRATFALDYQEARTTTTVTTFPSRTWFIHYVVNF